VMLQSVEYAEWLKREAGKPSKASDRLNDTSLRRFKRGTVLTYGFSIYNAKRPAGAAPTLTYQTKIYRDGVPIFENPVRPVVFSGTDPRSIDLSAALALGGEMAPGDYVLQITVVDALAKEKHNSTTQFVQFEVVE
jgi:hypothetical protein